MTKPLKISTRKPVDWTWLFLMGLVVIGILVILGILILGPIMAFK